MGYKFALYPISALLAVDKALEDAYARILATGADDPALRVRFSEHNDIVGLADFLARAGRDKA